MQTNEIYSLAVWFEVNVEQASLQSHYNTLLRGLRPLLDNATPQSLQKLEKFKIEQYRDLTSRLSAIDESALTDAQKDVLMHMELNTVILGQAGSYLHNLLLLPQDNSYVVATLKSSIDRLSRAIGYFKSMRTSMINILRPEFLDKTLVPDGKCLTRLKFYNDASINNVVNLRDWSRSWFTIARGFSMAVNQPPEDFEIISADKGSLILDLMLNIEVVKLITEAITSLAELATQIISVKLAVEGVKSLKGKMDEATYEKMLKQVTESLESDEEKIVEKVVEQLKEKNLIFNTQCNNELISAIRELTKYSQKGGGINCIASEANHEVCKSFNLNYKQLQEKSELKLIEDKDEIKD